MTEAPPANAANGDVLDLKNMQVDEKNLVMFRKKHLFVEMHELNNSEWHETHRWNYGLEEDLKRGEWTSAHLPTISVCGMMAFRDCLRPELVILNVSTEDAVEGGGASRRLRQIAMEIVNHLVRDGQIEPGNASAALDSLAHHLCLKKCVDHDTKLRTEHEELGRRNSCAACSLEQQHEPATAESAPASAAMPMKPTSKRSFSSLVSMHRTPSSTLVVEDTPPSRHHDALPPPPLSRLGLRVQSDALADSASPHHRSPTRAYSLRRRSNRLQKMISAKKLFGSRSSHSVKRRMLVSLPHVSEDPLRPDAEEEAVHVLIDDDFDELKSDAVVIVRLLEPIASDFEERLDYCNGNLQHNDSPSSGVTDNEGERADGERADGSPPAGATSVTNNGLLARFIVLVLGPKLDSKCLASEAAGMLHSRRLSEMGMAAAALMQDDVVVRALYEATTSQQLLEAIDIRLSAMRVLPHTSRPTKRAVRRRASRMYQQLAELRRIAEEQARQRLKEAEAQMAASSNTREPIRTPEVVELNNTGGRFLRLEYPDQGAKWGAREKDTFTYGFSVGALFAFAQKYALPLITGIILALFLANFRAGGYRRWAGVGHDDDDEEDDDHVDLYADDHTSRLLSGGGGGGVGHPTVFGLRIDGHDVTLHFLINDVLMTFFFGLAVKEIAEAFQPGGSLYPPSKKAINPMLGTLGGVVGPIVTYFALLALATLVPMRSGGEPLLSGANFDTLASGWGIPTATDISVAWVTAVVVFGTGHPAINFLLLCAVIDDGIGLLIIAVAYQDPDHPVKPISACWLLLVVLAMLIAWTLRKLECARWQMYVLLAGPFAWFGLLYASIHASLALCFVVPFMPIRIESDVPPATPTGEKLTVERFTLVDAEEGRAITTTEVGHHASPLHDFEESIKGFVDFGVLFAFGAVNAGVRLDEVGGYSFIILLALVIGKTLGMSLGSALAVKLGYARPEGMSFRHLIGAGLISSVGLTVSLFIAGEAFPNHDLYENQAKLGALFSVGPALILVALANISPASRRILLGPPTAKSTALPPGTKSDLHLIENVNDIGDIDDDHQVPNIQPHPDTSGIAGGLAGDGISASPRESKDQDDAINYEADYPEEHDEDEFLEDVVVRNIQKTLNQIHRIEQQVEERAGVKRSSTMLNIVHESCMHPVGPHPVGPHPVGPHPVGP